MSEPDIISTQVDRVKRMTTAITEVADIASVAVDTLQGKDKLEDVLRTYSNLKDAYDDFDDERKKIGALLDRMSRNVIPEMMNDRDIGTLTLKDIGKRFSYQTRVSCSMPDPIAGKSWLRENGHEGLITETVNSSSLSAFARTYIKESGKDLPEAFKVSTMLVTSVTKL